jgi:hypothetical protein
MADAIFALKARFRRNRIVLLGFAGIPLQRRGLLARLIDEDFLYV